MDHAEIRNRFGFHKGTIEGPNATAPKHANLRRAFVEFADMLNEVLPEGRAKAVVFTELQNASMWSHFAIAEGAPLVDETPTLATQAEPAGVAENWPRDSFAQVADDPNAEEAKLEEKGL